MTSWSYKDNVDMEVKNTNKWINKKKERKNQH